MWVCGCDSGGLSKTAGAGKHSSTQTASVDILNDRHRTRQPSEYDRNDSYRPCETCVLGHRPTRDQPFLPETSRASNI